MEEKFCKVIKLMAEEIASLRANNDLEWGEYNEADYNVENIINEYVKEVEEEVTEEPLQAEERGIYLTVEDLIKLTEEFAGSQGIYGTLYRELTTSEETRSKLASLCLEKEFKNKFEFIEWYEKQFKKILKNFE